MKHFPLMLLAATLAASPAWSQFGASPAPQSIEKARAKWPNLHFDISTPRSSYALGENIPVTMRYHNNAKAGLHVWVITYDRSGRIMEFGFAGRDDAAKTVRDPFPFLGGMGGGLRTQRGLGTYEQTVSLNEWLVFDRPGHYEITAWSGIVNEVGPQGTDGPSFPLQSAPLHIDILPPDEPSRQARIEAARVALGVAEKKAATLPTTQDSYQRDSELGPQVGAAMRDLRWMMDPRAIPLLLRGLELGGTAAFEAHRGLASFPEMAPVRAAILKRLKDGQPVVEGVWSFKNLLARSSPTSQKAPFSSQPTPEDEALFNAPLRAALDRDVKARNTSKAALNAATLLANDAKAPNEAAVWSAFWPGADSLSEDQQWSAALLLLQEKERSKIYPVAIPDLKRAANDGRLGEQLRSAAVVALAARGDFSLRPLLARDVTAPKTHFTPAAFATLSGFQARPIALRLLQQLREPDTSSFVAKDDLAARLRNFGSGATLQELISAARWLRVHFPHAEGALIEAVALRDQQKALTLIRESLAKRPSWEFEDARLDVLVRLNVPAARDQVRGFLGQKHENFLLSLLDKIGTSSHDSAQTQDVWERGRQRLRAPRALSQSLVPELARLAFSSPSVRVRQSAQSALMEVTELYGNRSNDAQLAAWRTDLRKWWQQHAQSLGRPISLANSI